MRVSVPGIPHALLSTSQQKQNITVAEAVERVANFLAPGNVAALTGAGVSVDSGIRAYRGHDGRYMNPNYKPIFYHELVDETERGHSFRQRYWLRSYLGYPSVRDALPNATHFSISALQYSAHIRRLITQNVDGLHHKAIQPLHWSVGEVQQRILELHGSLHFGHVVGRDTFQEWLSAMNPRWRAFTDELETTGATPRTNPDGDVALEGITYDDFVVPLCPSCSSEGRQNFIQKPEVIFFGESISKHIKTQSFSHIEECDRLFILGTTLATYSAFRLLKHAIELGKPVLLLNVGPTRADGVPGVEKIDMSTGAVLRDVVRALLGARVEEDYVLEELLRSGIFAPPSEETG